MYHQLSEIPPNKTQKRCVRSHKEQGEEAVREIFQDESSRCSIAIEANNLINRKFNIKLSSLFFYLSLFDVFFRGLKYSTVNI